MALFLLMTITVILALTIPEACVAIKGFAMSFTTTLPPALYGAYLSAHGTMLSTSILDLGSTLTHFLVIASIHQQ